MTLKRPRSSLVEKARVATMTSHAGALGQYTPSPPLPPSPNP